ncbi:MAG: aminopeptidase P family protein [Deltaproteobacteria bacterium]|nr:MAG: aminopeptidase P family protein [Deltaproteobacteria bacterium]
MSIGTRSVTLAVPMLLPLLAAAGFAHPNPQPPPELPAFLYRDRRERLMKEIGGCATAIAAQGEPTGVVQEYRQDDDFFWLTGINEPGAWLILMPKAKYRRHVLFLRPRDPEAERWTGPRAPLSPSLKAQYAVDEVRRGNGGKWLLGSAPAHDCLAVVAPAEDLKDERTDVQALKQGAGALGLKLVYKRDLLARMRSAHAPEEIALLERAVTITRAGHDAAARATVPGVSERDVQTQMEFAFFGAGATGLAYGTIVGSGENGAVLHWGQNSRMLRSGDLVVIDAGAEYGRYASDVTRTYPVSGKFTEEQAKVYRAVYQAQEDILAAIRPGASMSDLQKAAEESLRRSGYLDKFIHGFGHFVGLNVHDAGEYDLPIPAGAVFTVEPGVYLPERGFGVRIEDEVLFLGDGKWRLLTADFPRKLEDVEAWVARARR